MFKFLRKYNKIILAVFGSLLLVVFLVPQVVQMAQQAGARRSVWATVDGESINAVQRQLLQQEMVVLERVNPPILDILGVSNDPGHWYLLTREAEQAGMIPAPGLVRAQLNSTEDGRNLLSRLGNSDVAMQALAKVQGVQSLVQAYGGAAQLSDRRIRKVAREKLHGVGMDYIVLEADEDSVDYEPTEAEMREQMEKYADVAPGEGDMGFGYRLPDRFKLEYLEIPAAAVREAVRQSDDMNNIALREHWQQNADRFGEPQPTAIPDEVRADLLNKLVDEMLDAIAKDATSMLRAPRRGLPEQDGYVVLPDDWQQQQAKLEEVGQRLAEKYNLPETPSYYARQSWLDVTDLSDLRGIGSAETDKFGQRQRLAGIIPAAKEFGGSDVIGGIQQGVAGPPLVDRLTKNVYLFRITAVDPTRPPRELDEAREQVVTDLRKLRAYEQLVARGDALKQRVIEEGMVGLAMEEDAPLRSNPNVSLIDLQTYQQIARLFQQQGQQLPAGFGPRPTSLVGLQNSEPVIEEITEHALQLPIDQPMREVEPERRVVILPVEGELKLFIGQIDDQVPLTAELYRAPSILNLTKTLIRTEEIQSEQAVVDAFSFDALAARHGFEYQRRSDTPDDAAGDDADETQAAAVGQ